MSLLEADVDLTVVRDFLARVKERALGEKVEHPGEATPPGRLHARDARPALRLQVCEEELVALMGPVDPSLWQRRAAHLS